MAVPFELIYRDPGLPDRMADAIRSGRSVEGACGHAGISCRTHYKYMKMGEVADEDDLMRDYYVKVTQAEADLEAEAVGMWKQAFALDWKSAMEFLSRRFPGRWSPTQALRLGVDDGNTNIDTDDVLRKLVPELTGGRKEAAPGQPAAGAEGST